jgi:hypothetical protein
MFLQESKTETIFKVLPHICSRLWIMEVTPTTKLSSLPSDHNVKRENCSNFNAQVSIRENFTFQESDRKRKVYFFLFFKGVFHVSLL